MMILTHSKKVTTVALQDRNNFVTGDNQLH